MEKKYLDLTGLQDVASHVNTRLKTVTTIPASADDGAVRLYVGETGATYKKGHIYQYNATNLEWVDITGSTEYTAGNGIDITNDEISVETYIFTGTQAQWDALTTEQKKEYDICNITDDSSSDDEIYTKSEIDAMLGTAAGKDYTDVVRPNNYDLVESNAVYSAINNALSSIYTPRGDLTCAELTSALLVEQNVGNVYQMTDSGTTSALFINGAGRTININDNVGIIKAGQNTYLFNLMGNAFDLHDYQKKDLETAIESETTVEGALGALSTNKADTDDVYTKTEADALLDDKVSYEDNGILGAKNLLPFNFGHIKKINGGGTWNGNVYTYKDVTYTVNADGTITVNGTATDYSLFRIIDANSIFLNPNNNYYVTGSPSSSTASTYYVYYSELINGSWVYYSNLGNEDTLFTPNASATQVVVDVVVRSGATVNNLVFKPMLRLATDTDSTYQPYSMTNQQMTPYVQAISNPNLLDNPWFTINQRGITTDTRTEGTYRYTLDRWAARGIPTVKVNSDGSVTLDNTSGTAAYTTMQFFEPSWYNNNLKGKTVTISVDAVCSGNGSYCGIYQDQQSPKYQRAFYFSTTRQIYKNTITLGGNTATARLEFNLDVVAGESLTVYAVKLELGTVSTLAMDTAPNYASELLKCQRYFFKVSKDSVNTSSWVGIALANGNATCGFPAFPVTMRAKPTISNATAHSFDTKTAMTVTNVFVDVYGIQGVVLTDSVVGRGYSIAFEASADL